MTLIRTLWGRSELRYLFVAGCTAVGYLGVMAGGLALGWHYMVAILVAQVVAISAAFPAYRTWVFESRGKVLGDFVRFLSVWASGAIAGVVATPLLVELLHLHPLLAQVIGMVVVSVCSYLGHRFFSFRHRKAADEPVVSSAGQGNRQA